MIKSLFPQFKVGEGDTGAINITFSSTASHTVQPTHVNSTTTPERGREDHATVRVGHVRDVPSIIAHTKAGFLSILAHPGVGSSRVLEVRDYKRLVGVDGAPVLGAHHVGVNIESIDLAASPVTAIPVSATSVAGVEGGGDGVLVPLHGVVLGAPDVVTKVGIAVVISITWVVPWHVDEVGSSVTVATNIAEVQSVGEMLVIERSLPVSVRIPAIYCTVAEI